MIGKTKFICDHLLYLPHRDIMAVWNKNVCLAGGRDPIEQNFVFFDERFQCNHIDANTRIFCIDVFISLSKKYLKLQSERAFWFFTGKRGVDSIAGGTSWFIYM